MIERRITMLIPRAPALIIRLGLEEAPKVYHDALHEGEALRLDDWLGGQPELLDLVARAQALAERKRAA